jgi:hypothetical protein
MVKKPAGDPGTLEIGKDAAKAAVPFAGNSPPNPRPAPALPMADKSLTVKLRGDLYQALRNYCHETEKAKGGTRVTHQDVMVEALKKFLKSNGLVG